jgi:hypothetical protein
VTHVLDGQERLDPPVLIRHAPAMSKNARKSSEDARIFKEVEYSSLIAASMSSTRPSSFGTPLPPTKSYCRSPLMMHTK